MRNQSEPSNFAAIKTPISQEALDQLFREARTHSTWLPESRSETENTMSNSISTLLLRNLSDVFGENDPVRRAAIDEIFHEDAVFYISLSSLPRN